MGNSKALFAVGTTALTAVGTFVACGSDKAKTPDAPVHVIDAVPDSPKPVDAPPDASPYDFTCYGGTLPGSAADPITIAGTTESLSQSGATPVGSAAVGIYKTGTAAPVDSLTSAANGTFTSANITTGGVPFDGYIKAKADNYRVSYLYPSNPAVASIANLPVPLISVASFSQLNSFLQQNDMTNGVLFLTATDCNNMPLTGANVTVKQNGADVGTITDLGQLSGQAQLNGIFIVSNVPDGATDVSATFGSMTFPTHTVVAHKQEPAGSGSGQVGTLTITVVRPGP